MLGEIHEQFIKVVRDGRGKRLKDTPEIFSGLVWTGQRAVELGLADGYGSVESVARDVFKTEEVVDFTPDENYFERLSKRLGAAAADSALRALADAAARGVSALR
jgi:protease-4